MNLTKKKEKRYKLPISRMKEGLPWQSGCYNSVLPMQGAWV